MSARRSTICPVLVKMVTLVILTLLLVGPGTLAGTENARAAGGVSTQTVATIANADGSGQLVMMRMVFEPGVILVAQRDPRPVSFIVISGSLQTTLVHGGAAVNRHGVDQEVELGATMNLNAGVVISYAPNAVKSLANHGSEPLVLMETILVGSVEPMGAFEDSPAIVPFGLH